VNDRRESPYLIALDIETTGLDKQNDQVLEIALVVLDRATFEEIECFETVVRPQASLADIGYFVRDMHTRSGLFAEIEFGTGLSLRDALDRVRDITSQYPQSLLLGRNVGSFDRAFLETKRPGVLDALHYRCLDLSALLLFWKIYDPTKLDGLPKPADTHRAMADVRGDIALLRAITRQ